MHPLSLPEGEGKGEGALSPVGEREAGYISDFVSRSISSVTASFGESPS
jgi:hypothetical protein